MNTPETTSIIDAEADLAINMQQRSTYSKLYNVAGSVLNGTADTVQAILPLAANMGGRAVNTIYHTVRGGLSGLQGKPYNQAA